jgi:hypothetical protein
VLLAMPLLFLAALPAMAVSPWDAVNQVSQGQYQTYQVAIQDMGLGLYGGESYDQGYRNRYNAGGSATASLGSREATLYLTDQFTAMGLSISTQSDYVNVVAERVGTETPERIFIVSGHYDHPEADFEAPGGDDNASGTAGVLEAARALSQYDFSSTIRFIAWGGEEGWMKGSWDYVRNVVQAGQEDVVGVLNMDMILRPGWDSDPAAERDLDLSTGTSPACQAWAYRFMASVATYAPSLVLDPRNPQSEDWYPGDQGPFIQEGYVGLMIAENNADEIWHQGCNAYYHKAGDASDRGANDGDNGSGVVYDYAFATDVVRAVVGMIAEEAGIVPGPPMPGDADEDGDVDGFDYLALKRAFGRCDGVGWPEGDFDASGCVDRLDFLALRANFARRATADGAVPEPATLWLLALAALAAGRRRHRAPALRHHGR